MAMVREFCAKQWYLILIVVGIFAAVVWPAIIQPLTAPISLTLVSGLALFFMSLGLETRELWGAVRRPWPALLALLTSYIVCPLLAFVLAFATENPDYRIGLIVAGSVPCSLASATIWTRLAGGNAAISLLVTVLSNALVFVFTAFWLAMLTRTQVSFDVLDMVRKLALVAALPVLVAQCLRAIRPLAQSVDRHKFSLGVVARLLVWIIIVKAAGMCADRIQATHGAWSLLEMLELLVLCLALHVLTLRVAWASSRKLFSRRDSAAVAFAGSQKTLPVGAFLIEGYFVAFPLAILPMLFYHVGQLVVDTVIAERFRSEMDPEIDRPAEKFS